MPALDSADILFERSTNTSGNSLKVICAWPVSGQYGVGSRVLYYVLVTACIFARKEPWLRNACLAAALLFPAIGAIHGVVLAALHVKGAVDMDVYGAFQFCSVGVLAAPITVRLSKTYFYDPGRNIIFLWSLLILAGLLSLMIEFYRINAVSCQDPSFQNSLPLHPREYPILKRKCGITCSVSKGPFSPLRGGSADNIYVIPAPTKLTFGAATLLAGACCIPAILLLVSMWIKILQVNWKKRTGLESQEKDNPNQKPSIFKRWLKLLRQHPEIPIFGGVILTILIIGERNLFSAQVRYQTEPITNVGQWGPLVGTGLAIFGSLYMLIADAMILETAHETTDVDHNRRVPALHREADNSAREDHGIIRGVARRLSKFSNYFGIPKQGRFDETEFQRGRATSEYPEIPGEDLRHRGLDRLRTGYSSGRASSDSIGSPRPDSNPVTPKGVSPHRRARSETLEVPEPVHTAPARTNLSPYEDYAMQSITTPESQDAPTIVVSPHVDESPVDEYP